MSIKPKVRLRFWQKVLILVFLTFIIAVDICVVAVMRRNWSLSLAREFARCENEQLLISNNIYENLNTLSSRGMAIDDKLYFDIASSYGDYYQGQGISLALWNGESLIYSALDNSNIESNLNIKESEGYYITTMNIRYIKIFKPLPEPYGGLAVVYLRDINSLYQMQDSLNRFFLIINVATGMCLVLFLYIVLRHLTKPLVMLSETTSLISEGDYSRRVYINSTDEFGELAESFNKMAMAIEERIEILTQMAAERQRLVDNMAHELRTPLTSMQGFAEYLLNAKADEYERITAAEYIKSQSMRLNALANKLLQIGSLNHANICLKPVNVSSLFSLADEAIKPQLLQSGLKLISNIEIEAVIGDSDLLVSFLTNCIQNSIYASQSGGRIYLDAYEKDDLGVLEVTDEGTGMTAEQAQHAFEPFYRTDKSRSRQNGGVGLGLTLCKKIAEIHGGSIEILPAKDKGTTVRIFLQLHNNFNEA